ncbi:MAG: hypothetical protein AB8G99_18445 [Planctomycetaceae bacterium]
MRRLSLLLSIVACVLLGSYETADAQIRIRSSTTQRGPDGQVIQGPKVGERKFGDKPVARVWHSKINAANGFQYIQKVSRELEIKQSPFMMIPPGAGDVAGPAMSGLGAKRQELKGVLVYLAKGLIPIPASINFKRIANEKEFRKEVMAAKAMWGDAAQLIGKGNKYEVKVDLGQMANSAPAPKDSDDSKKDGEPAEGGTRAVIAFSARVGSGDGAGEPTELPEGIELGPMSTFYRYNDGIMFDSQAPELHDMRLPKIEDLTLKREQDALDLYADVDLSQVPQAYKEIFWNAIKVKANAFLQKYDEEPDEEYAVRKASGQFSMELTRAAILDVDRIRLSLTFVKGEEPLNLDVVVDARKNSNLAKQLGAVSRGVSGFNSLRKKKSPMTIASAWQMPQNFRNMAKAVFEKGKLQLEEQLASDADGLLAVEEMFDVLSQTVDAGSADAILKLGGDPKTGFALYGGLRVQGADALAKNLSVALNGLPASPENQIHVTREDDREFLSFRLDELYLPGEENKQLPAQLHFTVANSCLWFSVGGVTSFDVLKSVLADAEEGRSDRKTPAAPFVLDLQLSDWLKSAEAEAANEFSELPMQTLQRFEEAVHRTFANQFSFTANIPGMDSSKSKMEFRDSYLAKAIADGQDELHVEIDTSPKTVRAKAQVGEGIIKFVIARFLEVQSRAMENMSFEVIESEEGGRRSITVRGGSAGGSDK